MFRGGGDVLEHDILRWGWDGGCRNNFHFLSQFQDVVMHGRRRGRRRRGSRGRGRRGRSGFGGGGATLGGVLGNYLADGGKDFLHRGLMLRVRHWKLRKDRQRFPAGESP